ncbi:MAG: pseudouridine synthase [Hydrogenophilales bacterium]|nr:pseudouridine synthase [Hydrogenophilales bacterium]
MSERLHKLLAAAGVGSRREIEEWIRAGRITVNGEVATLGLSIETTDRIMIDKRPFRFKRELKSGLARPPRVLIYNKPEGEIVSRDDPEGRTTVFQQLPRIKGAKWISVGRLDINSGGLLLFTTSGELANRLMHPSYEIEREYAVRVMGVLTKAQMQRLVDGVQLEDGIGKFDYIEDRGGEGSNHWYHVVLKEGHKREVRRIFQAGGFLVSRLLRVRYGSIRLPPRVKRGQLIELELPQVNALLASVGLIEAPAEKVRPQRNVKSREEKPAREATPRKPGRTGEKSASKTASERKPGGRAQPRTGRTTGEEGARPRRKPR